MIGDLAALTDDDLRRLLPGSVGTMLRDCARGIDPRELELGAERISISVENTFERDISNRERLHEELRGMATEVAAALQRQGQVARTVTTKLRYADFSIRSRSASLHSGVDAAETIGDLACSLLDRGLRDRPGALRLVGVGVSGLADFPQWPPVSKRLERCQRAAARSKTRMPPHRAYGVSAQPSEQGRQDSNLRPTVLETAALPTELRPCAGRPVYPATFRPHWPAAQRI